MDSVNRKQSLRQRPGQSFERCEGAESIQRSVKRTSKRKPNERVKDVKVKDRMLFLEFHRSSRTCIS